MHDTEIGMTEKVAAAAGPYGRRLVYGGHTIAVAAGQLSRVLPNLLTVLAWRTCDHTGPVFEGDELRSRFTIEALHRLRDGAALVEVHAVTSARGDAPDGVAGERSVLDWRLVALG